MNKQSKSSNPLFLVVVMLLALEIGTLFFRSEDQLQHDLAKERAELTGTLGTHAADLVDRADAWFGEWFVESGVIVESMHVLSPSENATEQFEADLNSTLLTKTEDTGRAFWTGIYIAVHRVVVAVAFLPILFVFGFASMYDGFQQRKIKLLGFAQSSRTMYSVAVMMNSIFMMLPLLYMFAPVAVPVVVIPAWMTMLGLTIQLQTSNVPRI